MAANKQQQQQQQQQLSMAASALAMRGVRLFLSAGRAAAEKRVPASAPPKARRPKPVVVGARPPQKVFDSLFKTCKFNK